MSKVGVLTSQKIDQRQYGTNVTWHETIDSVLQTKPDYAVVATSAVLHGEYLDALVAKSCKVLIEKPVAATAEQAKRIQNVAKSVKPPPVIAHNIRFSRAPIWSGCPSEVSDRQRTCRPRCGWSRFSATTR